MGLGVSSGEKKEDDGEALGLLGMVTIGFFWVSGGVYANEPLVNSCPPGFVFIGLIGCAILFSLPISLITAELATAIPEDAGMVVWIDQACGSRIGSHNAYWTWVGYLGDSCVYPILFGEYVCDHWGYSAGLGRFVSAKLLAIAVVVFTATIKLRGMDFLVTFSTLFAAFSLLPSTIYTVWGLKDIDWSLVMSLERPAQTPEDWKPNWAVWINWLLWLNVGFFAFGSLAGDVKDPKKTFINAALVLIVVTVVNTALPIMIFVSVQPDLTRYAAGSFTDVVSMKADWLGTFFTVGAMVAFLGLYSSQVITAETTMAFIAKQKTSRWHARQLARFEYEECQIPGPARAGIDEGGERSLLAALDVPCTQRMGRWMVSADYRGGW
jgi:amino acid transporter